MGKMGKKSLSGPDPVVFQLLGMSSEHSGVSGRHGAVWPCVPTAQLSPCPSTARGGHGGDISLPGTGLSSARLAPSGSQTLVQTLEEE